MKLFLPYVEELSLSSTRMMRIAQLLGAECEPIRLPRESANPVSDFENGVGGGPASIAICPEVMRAWLGTGQIPPVLVSCLTRLCQFILLHELDTDSLSEDMARTFSEQRLTSVRAIKDVSTDYQVASDPLCGAFAGLSFGPANMADRVLLMNPGKPPVNSIVSVGNKPLFARVKYGGTEIFLLACTATVDIDNVVTDRKISEYFSQLLPVAMFIRHAFQEMCWRPGGAPHATLLVDDPPLWKKYGFLNYERLLALMDQFHFHTTVAFIPYYWRSSSRSTVQLFRERPERLSICFHGNDHTAGEFATENIGTLNFLLRTADKRMQSLRELTGIPVDKVMVFPQGEFSRNAMQALAKHDFVAAVNSECSPRGERVPLTVADIMQPSLLKFGNFPLFLRRYPGNVRPEDVALHAFFGRPILVVEHHEIFRDPSAMLNAVAMVNKIIPKVQWRSVQNSLENSCLVRRTEDQTVWIRPYARVGRITNSRSTPIRCIVEWHGTFKHSGATMLLDGIQAGKAIFDSSNARTTFDVAPNSSRVFEIRCDDEDKASAASLPPQSFKYRMKVHLRRGLSEMRDNYLSRSPMALSLARSALTLLKGPNSDN